MKKSVAILLILAVLLWALPALAESCDDALDAAFDAGRVAFAQAPFPLPDVAGCELVMPPDELWGFAGMEPMSEAEIREALAQAQFIVCSYAPDGSCGIGLLAAGDGALPFALSPNRVAIIWPNEGRGVYDDYGLPGTVYQRFFLYRDSAAGPYGMGGEGAIWSPTGRYCCVLNSMRVLREMRMEFGAPLVIDTHTGELFALDSFSPKMMSEDGGGWIDGCFAGDESAFYAMTFSNRYSDRFMLVRYDLETCDATPCAGFEANSLPAMAALSDGSMLALIDTWQQDEPQALARIAPDGLVEAQPLLLAGDYWRYRVTNACSSAESDFALLRGAFILQDDQGGGGYFGLQRLNADDLSDDAGTIWVLSTLTGRFEPLDAAHMPATMKDWVMDFYDRHMQILDVKLSPGGRYAAVFAAMTGARQGETALLIARLSDMAVLPAQGVDTGNTDAWVSGLAAAGKNLMSWSEAGLLLSSSGLWRPEEQG